MCSANSTKFQARFSASRIRFRAMFSASRVRFNAMFIASRTRLQGFTQSSMPSLYIWAVWVESITPQRRILCRRDFKCKKRKRQPHGSCGLLYKQFIHFIETNPDYIYLMLSIMNGGEM